MAGWTLINYPTLADDPQRCLGIASNGTAGLWNCTFTNDQEWHYGDQFDSSGYYQIVNVEGKCLGVSAGSEDKGARIVAAKCGGTSHPDQYWTIDFPVSGSYECYVFNYNSGYVIGVSGGDTSNGSPVVQWSWENKRNNQLWVLSSDSDVGHALRR